MIWKQKTGVSRSKTFVNQISLYVGVDWGICSWGEGSNVKFYIASGRNGLKAVANNI